MQTLRVRDVGPIRHLTLDRPDKRNAMSLRMVDEIESVVDGLDGDGVRVLVLRGAGGHFCAGGDVSDMARASAEPVVDRDPIAVMNRRFGALLERLDQLPQAVVAVCEGAVMGGGIGLACIADVTLAVEGARFRLPETSLGIPPAQIAPYLVQRLGLSQARRLAVTGETLGAAEAHRLHLAHHHVQPADLDSTLTRILSAIGRCEPSALAATKAIVHGVGARELGPALDAAAEVFASHARAPQAQQGFAAFLQRKAPPWAFEEGA